MYAMLNQLFILHGLLLPEYIFLIQQLCKTKFQVTFIAEVNTNIYILSRRAFIYYTCISECTVITHSFHSHRSITSA